MMNREAIWTTLFALLSELTDFAETGRVVKHWADCSNFPAMFLSQGGESVSKSGRGLPCTYTMSAEIYLYVRNDSNDTPATQINALLDLVTDVFKPNPNDGLQTLGGRVQDAWIEGSIMRDEGVLGDTGVAIVPIKILVTQ
jgi:hypothetical protein